MSCCCDGVACVICADNFDRTDGTDITTGSACGWTEESGAWEIATNRLRATGPTGIVSCNTFQAGVPGNYISVNISSDRNNRTANVVVNFEDTSNYDFVEVNFSATTGQIKIWEVVAGTPNELAASASTLNIALNTDHLLLVCLRGGFLNVKLTHGATTTGLTTALDGQADSKVGLARGKIGGGPDGNIEFDNWSYERNASELTGCNDCQTNCADCVGCNGGFATNWYQVSITGVKNPPVTDRCSQCEGINGTYLICFVGPTVCIGSFDSGFNPCFGGDPFSNLVTINLDFTTTQIQVSIQYTSFSQSHVVKYLLTTAGGVDCMNLFDELMTFSSSDNPGSWLCDFADAQVRISTQDCQTC